MADQQTAPPSRAPSNDDTLVGMFRTVLGKFVQNLDDCLPARVIAYDRTSNRATVQPLIQMVTTEGERVSRAQVASVPVFQIGAGGWVLHFPIKPGDIGWIKATDRDMSLFLQRLAEGPPNTKRMHSFEDGVFFPAVLSGHVIAAEDSDHPVFQSLDGSTRVALWPEFAKVTAPRGLLVSDGDGEGSENAVFDVRSTVKAAMPLPRMTTGQRDAIPDPEEGMGVWLTDQHRASWHDGTAWS